MAHLLRRSRLPMVLDIKRPSTALFKLLHYMLCSEMPQPDGWWYGLCYHFMLFIRASSYVKGHLTIGFDRVMTIPLLLMAIWIDFITYTAGKIPTWPRAKPELRAQISRLIVGLPSLSKLPRHLYLPLFVTPLRFLLMLFLSWALT